jgi:hypothetical protein
MTLLQANLEHARRVKKRQKLEARRTVLATRIVSAQREAAKLLAAQQRKAEERIGGGEEKKRIEGKREGEKQILQIEGGDGENGKVVLTDEMRDIRRARGRTVITIGNRQAGEAAKERRVIELAKALLRPLPELPPEPKHRRKNK